MADTKAVDSNQLADFQGLPISNLISDPLVACAASQKELAAVTLDFINDVGFVTDKDGKVTAATVTVDVPRFVVGKDEPVMEKVSMPLLAVVSIPNLSIDDVNISFTMEVKAHTAQNSSNDKTDEDGSSTDITGKVSGGFWGAKASTSVTKSKTHTGTVSSHSDQTRSSDFSAKYNITVSAKQMPPAEGMSKFTQILASTIESQPINTESV
tara:strand:- start:134 stop:766 length:633 start_codon:yes stop_codon:yes gene_type:complete